MNIVCYIVAGQPHLACGLAPYHKDQIYDYLDDRIPFARTSVKRLANSDPCLSLLVRYGDHARYVATVRKAAFAVATEFLLQADGEAMIQAAEVIKVLNGRAAFVASGYSERSGRTDGMSPVSPPTPPYVRFSAYGG